MHRLTVSTCECGPVTAAGYLRSKGYREYFECGRQAKKRKESERDEPKRPDYSPDYIPFSPDY